MSVTGDARLNSDSSDGADDVFFVSMQYRGAAYSIPVQVGDPVASIFDFAQEALTFPREFCKLIYRGKTIRPDHESLTIRDAGIIEGSKLMLMASSAHDVNFVRTNRPDPLVKGFAEEERDEKARKRRAQAASATAWGTKQDSEYRFASMKAEFKYSTPPPYDAEKLLQKLATDPGIIDIMKSRNFKVGILTEMSPVEAQERMAKRGTPNMDLLGYNQNAGEMIVLRLRTDNLKGFRPYQDLINTLIHELTHNVWGPHDHNFWKLFGELKAQYMRFHSFYSHNGKTANGGASGQFQGFATGDDVDMEPADGFGHVLGVGTAPLGGNAPIRDPRSLAAEAAETRLASAVATGIGVAGSAAKPEPPLAVQRLGLPNFLSGDGSWKIVCPCGQTHDFDAMCQESAAASSAADGSTNADKSVPMDCDAPASMEDGQCSQAALAGNFPPSLSSHDPRDAGAIRDLPPSSLAPVESEIGLAINDLAAQGLDGASIWLTKFENNLRVLGCRENRKAVAALRLLLRLVENIVGNPSEQKYRRIRADNPRVRADLLEAGVEVEKIMTLLGFESLEESGERIFVLRDATFDTARLRMGQEILQREVANADGLTVQ